MFTGLIEALGTIRDIRPDGPGRWLTVAEPAIAADAPRGASVAVNGVCLTVVERGPDWLRFQAGPETLQRTNLGELTPGATVNLERSLRLGDRLGGHIVQGHVDAVGAIERREPQADWETVWFTCPPELTRQMIPKGSIAIDGVSLTLVTVQPGRFSVALIPHTLAVTTLGKKPPGATVNLETDMFGKYVVQYLEQLSLPRPRP
ncbi:MAG: riboflavin synthase [Gemmataceae bacterium]